MCFSLQYQHYYSLQFHTQYSFKMLTQSSTPGAKKHGKKPKLNESGRETIETYYMKSCIALSIFASFVKTSLIMLLTVNLQSHDVFYTIAEQKVHIVCSHLKMYKTVLTFKYPNDVLDPLKMWTWWTWSSERKGVQRWTPEKLIWLHLLLDVKGRNWWAMTRGPFGCC